MAGKVKASGAVGGSKAPGQKSDTVRVKLTLRRESLRRLKLEAFGRGDVPLGQVVDDLVMGQAQRFVLMDRAKGSGGSEGSSAPAGHGGSDRQEARPGPAVLGLVSEAG